VSWQRKSNAIATRKQCVCSMKTMLLGCFSDV